MCVCFLPFFFLSSSSSSVSLSSPEQTKGPSMYPTFEHEGDVVLVEHLSRQRRTLKPGDVVISVCPHEPRKMICKRLLALEGQTVDVSGIQPQRQLEQHQHRQRGFAASSSDQEQEGEGEGVGVHVDDSPSSSSNSPSSFIQGKDLIRVPKGHVWIQGDNLQNSTDSRYYGPVPYSLLRGRVFYKIWPPSEFGPIRDAPQQSNNKQ